MHRPTLLTSIATLGQHLGWTAQELGLLKGSWGRKASDVQLAAILARLQRDWDATAHPVLFDLPAPVVVPAHDWIADLFIRSLPLATFPSQPLPFTAADERVAKNRARFYGDKQTLDDIAAWKAQVERERRVEVMGRVA